MIDELLDGPGEADGGDEVEHQAVVGITLPGDGDEEFTGDRMGHEDGGGVGAEEDEELEYEGRKGLYESDRTDDNHHGNPQPGVEGEGHSDDEETGDRSQETGVVAEAVDGVAIGVAEDLQEPTDGDQRHDIPRTAAVEQETIDDVKLQHQAEEPVDARPDNLVGLGQHVDVHKQLGDDVVPMEGETARSDGVDHDEQHEADDEHPQEFQIMVAEEGERIKGTGRAILSRIMALSP